MSENTNSQHDDEIDLVELIVNLWRERAVIILSVLVVTGIGSIYAFSKDQRTQLYEVKAQLIMPSSRDLNIFNQTENFKIEPEEAFSIFLSTLESADHNLATNNQIKKKLDQQTKIPNASSREIIYQKKVNELSSDIYSAIYTGESIENLTLLLTIDLKLAAETSNETVKNNYDLGLKNEKSRLENIQYSSRKVLESKLIERKAYILSARKNEINKLQEALKVARALKFESPTTLSKLAGDTSTVVNIKNIISSPHTIKNNISSELTNVTNNKNSIIQPVDEKEQFIPYVSHLETKDYLKGEKLLSAEIKNLNSLSKDVFFDDVIVMLEGKKGLLGSSLELEKLELLSNEANIKPALNFYSENIVASLLAPQKYKTALIIAVTVLLGGMLGFFIAIGRIMVRKYNSKSL